MSPLAELVGALSDLEVAGLLPLAVALAAWPGAALAARLAGRRDSRPAVQSQVSYRPGRAAVRYNTAVYVGGSW